MNHLYLATEQCGCFVGIEPPKSELLALWKASDLLVKRVTPNEASEARLSLFCSDEHRKGVAA